MRTQRRLPAALLHVAWTRQLAAWWQQYNEEYLAGALRPPRFELGAAATQLGRWDGQLRRLVISRAHIERDPWVAVLATLRHEMAHQFADEVLHAGDEPPHGPAFLEACRRLRCLASDGSAAAGGAAAAAEPVLARVRKILSLATSPNAHEAAAAARQARRVLLRHNLRAVHAEAPREFVCGYVGAVKARHATHEQWLAQILHEFFFVEAIWVGSYEAAEARCGTVLQVCGTPQNVALAAYVHASLTAQAECLWRQYRAAQGLAGDRHRARYLAGVLAGFCAKLREQEERVRADEALVWKGDSQLRQFVRHLHPRLRTRQGRGTPVTAIYRAGVAAGRKLALPRGMPAAEARVRGYLSSG